VIALKIPLEVTTSLKAKFMTLKTSLDTSAQNYKFAISTQADFISLQGLTYHELKIVRIGQKHYFTRISKQITSNQINYSTKTYNYSICTI